MEIKYDSNNLIPAVCQDSATGEVLMVAWINDDSLTLTQQTGQAHFWSRSRGELWHKGATTGNFLNVDEIRVDCDADTLLLSVTPEGPACHTGERTCFYRTLSGEGESLLFPQTPSIFHQLESIIEDRKSADSGASYTASLIEKGEDTILQKVGEEAVEVLLAAKGQGRARTIEETADLMYHLLVMLAVKNIKLADIEDELRRRHTDKKAGTA